MDGKYVWGDGCDKNVKKLPQQRARLQIDFIVMN
jgi:hypothetical protein